MVFIQYDRIIYNFTIFKRNYKKDLLKDFLKLSFIFTFIFQTLNDLNPYYPKIISEIVQIICKKLNLIKIKGNIFYFAFGYYIQKKKKLDYIIEF